MTTYKTTFKHKVFIRRWNPDMVKFCLDTFGTPYLHGDLQYHFLHLQQTAGTMCVFRNEQDAAVFALRWTGH